MQRIVVVVPLEMEAVEDGEEVAMAAEALVGGIAFRSDKMGICSFPFYSSSYQLEYRE